MGGVQNANLRLILTLDFGTKAAWIKLVESGPNSKQSESLDLVTSKRLIVLPVSCPFLYSRSTPLQEEEGGRVFQKVHLVAVQKIYSLHSKQIFQWNDPPVVPMHMNAC